MEFIVHTDSPIYLAELNSTKIEIRETQDALDMMADARQLDASAVIIYEHQIEPVFFDLKTGMAGEILQKFSNYRMKLAIIGDFSKFTSKSLRDFIYESNKQGRICFVSELEEAKSALRK